MLPDENNYSYLLKTGQWAYPHECNRSKLVIAFFVFELWVFDALAERIAFVFGIS